MDIPATETKNEGAEMIDLNELKKKAYEYSRKRAENGGTAEIMREFAENLQIPRDFTKEN